MTWHNTAKNESYFVKLCIYIIFHGTEENNVIDGAWIETRSSLCNELMSCTKFVFNRSKTTWNRESFLCQFGQMRKYILSLSPKIRAFTDVLLSFSCSRYCSNFLTIFSEALYYNQLTHFFISLPKNMPSRDRSTHRAFQHSGVKANS